MTQGQLSWRTGERLVIRRPTEAAPVKDADADVVLILPKRWGFEGVPAPDASHQAIRFIPPRQHGKRLRCAIAEAYQIAGRLFSEPSDLTAGQITRLETLLLDVLSDPERYSADTIENLYREAMEP